MKKLSEQDLIDIALGATVLGSGGGGDPSYELLMALQLIEEGKSLEIVSLETIPDDALVLPVAFMGAPLVSREKFASGREFDQILDRVSENTYLLPAEIGGANALTPLLAAARRGLQVVDGDTLGRAFPRLEMTTCNLFDISPSPAYLADAFGTVKEISAQNADELESICRDLTVTMGSSAAIAAYPMTGREAQRTVISGSISKALTIGKLLRTSADPIQSLCQAMKGQIVASGMITDVSQHISKGFLEGSFSIGEVTVFYQNEYLYAVHRGACIGATPDIIIPIEQESAMPLASESLQYGLRVDLIVLPSPEVWRSARGMELVGPKVFGYEGQI